MRSQQDTLLFQDRTDAGRQLAEKLVAYADQPEVLVLVLPRSGVPVAFEVANAIHAPLDIFLVRQLGVPGHEEVAMGAIATGSVRMINPTIVNRLGICEQLIEATVADELVDDGLATGSTMLAAVTAVRQQQPSQVGGCCFGRCCRDVHCIPRSGGRYDLRPHTRALVLGRHMASQRFAN